MNFARDVLDRLPPRDRALVELARDGSRREWTFGAVADRTARLAGTLRARGVEPGDVVMTLIGNRPEWVIAMCACMRIGAVVLPCTEQLRAKDLRLRIEVARPRLIVADERNRAELERALAGTGSGDTARGGDSRAREGPREGPHEHPGRHSPASWDSRARARAHANDRASKYPEAPDDREIEVLLVPDEALFAAAPAPAVELGADEPCLIAFTSGTAGEPKAVVHAQRYLPGQGVQAAHWLRAGAGELVWCTAASGWSKSARNVFIAPWLSGAGAVLHDARFDPHERLELLERERVSVLCMAPTEYRVIAKRATPRAPGSLHTMVAAGEALNPEVLHAWREATGIAIRDGYGQTETGQLTGMPSGEPVRPGSMGRPLPGVSLRVVDGELIADPETVGTFFLGYLGEGVARAGDAVARAGDESESERALRANRGDWRTGEGASRANRGSERAGDSRAGVARAGEGGPGAWRIEDRRAGGPWHTGDRVRVDEDGYLWFEGRADDVIVSAGYRIGPFEVESALVSHPAVAEAAAVAAPDSERGAVVRAVVVLREGYDPAGGGEAASAALARELQEHVKRETAPYKYPRIVEFAPELPKTASGKIKRAQLRAGH